jgi:hypothetical protein
MIVSVEFMQPAPAMAVSIIMADGSAWTDDASLAPDTELRRALADWIEAGGVIAPHVAPVAPPVVPQSVSMAQARIALASIGKLAAVNALLDGLPEPQRTPALLAWEYAPTVSRTGNLVTTLGPALGLDDAALDALFMAAGNITL